MYKLFLTVATAIAIIILSASTFGDGNFIEVYSNIALSITSDSTNLVYTIPSNINGVHKYTVANDLSDTVIVKLSKPSGTSYRKIRPSEIYNREEYFRANTKFYIYTNGGSGGAIRAEIFRGQN
jgi:hypothetical protein